jgi:hypothetical protein
MTNKIFYEKDYAKIEYLADVKTLKITWVGFVSFAGYKEVLQKILDCMKEMPQVCRIFTDQSQRKVMTSEETEWFIKEFAPAFIKSRTQSTRLALIKPKDTFGKLSTALAMSKVVEKYEHGFVSYSYFDTAEEAQNWLLELDV